MNTVFNKINEFIALGPRHYKFLKSINLTRNISQESCSKYDVELVLSRLEINEHELHIKFNSAFDIKLGRLEGLFGLLVDIEDVSNMQLEGARYRVVEQEEQAFSFYCEDFYPELIAPKKHM
ncbi:hypothetical protein [Methylobacter luteus]|uniref:hypothetical protein n=1 Tax=Methylobacter luteus TaxID=415 RepID=UPI000484DE4D|nr:hypothetical protein [Methylobacter luteus]